METKRFPLRVILTVTTGRLLTKRRGERDNGIEDLHAILGWMCGDEPFTHSLGRFAEECKPWLLRWFPEIALLGDDVERNCKRLDELPREDRTAALDLIIQHYRGDQEYDVPRIPKGEHVERNPIEEICEMVGTEKVIPVVIEATSTPAQ
jgi:hypothetical protein